MEPTIRIPLSGNHRDKFVLIDAADAALVQERKWYLSSSGYAVSTRHRRGCSGKDPKRNENVKLHRLILGNPDGLVDHINGDRLDCRRCNLRVVGYKENAWNTRRSGTVGVSVNKEGRYQVWLGATQYGAYEDEKTAALVYDEVCRHIRGEYAVLNYPEERLPDDFKIVNFNTPPSRARYRSGVSGVLWHETRRKWRVIVKQKSRGYFESMEEAIAARCKIYEEEGI